MNHWMLISQNQLVDIRRPRVAVCPHDPRSQSNECMTCKKFGALLRRSDVMSPLLGPKCFFPTKGQNLNDRNNLLCCQSTSSMLMSSGVSRCRFALRLWSTCFDSFRLKSLENLPISLSIRKFATTFTKFSQKPNCSSKCLDSETKTQQRVSLGVAASVASASSDDNKVLNDGRVDADVDADVDGGLHRARGREWAKQRRRWWWWEWGGSTLNYG